MMKRNLLLLLILASPGLNAQIFKHAGGEKQRLMILADMGNEPDEEQQMMHMLMCSDMFDLEGLVAVTGKYLQPPARNPYKQVLHPELFHHLMEGYGKVYENLLLHSPDYPSPEFLRNMVVSGQPGYGIESTGEGMNSVGSDLIIKVLEKDDPRPLYVVVNAGSNTLAQALKDYSRSHGQEDVNTLVDKLIVFENGAQDNAGAWICATFPSIRWYRSNYQTYCYGGPGIDGMADNSGKSNALGPYCWEPYAYSGLGQHQWALEHIKGNHGPFGNYWPLRQFGGGGISFMEGGGTIPWLGLCSPGLSDIEHLHWGGWSGRFGREKVENYWSKHSSVNKDEKDFAPFQQYAEEGDFWTDPESGLPYEGIFTPVWRWRRAFYNDFVCRMDWCTGTYGEVNHHPEAWINGDGGNSILVLDKYRGRELVLDASGSRDPDGDKIRFRWYVYPEAGTYGGEIPIEHPGSARTSIPLPKDAGGREIHIILEVWDENQIAPLCDYRRVIIAL